MFFLVVLSIVLMTWREDRDCKRNGGRDKWRSSRGYHHSFVGYALSHRLHRHENEEFSAPCPAVGVLDRKKTRRHSPLPRGQSRCCSPAARPRGSASRGGGRCSETPG